MMFINGRFLTQRTSGVQRFARELVKALDASLAASDALDPWVLLTPPGVSCDIPLQKVEVRATGRRSGHLWEQIDLFAASRRGVLVNLCNSGPVLHHRSLTIIHDTMVFRTPGNFSLGYRTFHRILGRILARRSHLGTVSEFSRGELAALLRASSVTVIPNSAEHMAAVKPAPDTLQRLGLSSGRYAMFVGNQTPNKNIATAIAAVERLGAELPLFVVVGALDSSVFGATKSAMSERVLFAGRLGDSDLVSLYRDAAMLVFPSLYEGFGIPPLEAMMYGCPVVASDIPPVREVCGDAALYVDARSATAIADAMRRLLGDTALRQELAARGRARAALFSWAASAAALRHAAEAL